MRAHPPCSGRAPGFRAKNEARTGSTALRAVRARADARANARPSAEPRASNRSALPGLPADLQPVLLDEPRERVTARQAERPPGVLDHAVVRVQAGLDR